MLGRAAISLAVVVGALVALIVVLVASGLLRAFRIPSAAMEPTLHCPRPNALCEGRFADRFLSLKWHFWPPGRITIR